MVLEQETLPLLTWLLQGGGENLLGALPRFLLVFGGLSLFFLLIGFAVSASRRGLLAGGDAVYRNVAAGFGELFALSPRRVWALARLAIKEALRRRVLVALGVFLLVLLFANWFLRTDMPQPARLYVSFVLTATTYLVLGVSLFLSSFSLPADFKSKTIYTVVTKPVRAGEIVLGRIIGFTLVATALLAAMGAAQYVFVVRSLQHEHRIGAEDLRNVVNAAGEVVGRKGETTSVQGHVHEVTINADGRGQTSTANGHTHDVDRVGERLVVSSPRGFLRARVPQYGKLRFIDRSGAPKDRGISVGSEWAYRSFIDGNTPATAIWTFRDVRPGLAVQLEGGEEVLPVALLVRVFRTHKGVVGRPLQGSIQLRNPESGLTSDPLPFDALDQQVEEFDLLRKQKTATGQEVDLFDDLADKNGQVEVLVKCLEGGQYFGFAQADCYLRRPDGDPLTNFGKVLASLWVQAVIVIAVGVAISTMVSGPVALLFTVVFVLIGFYRQDFLDVARGVAYGGGPAESVLRMVNQANVITKLDDSALSTVVTLLDRFLSRPFMWCVAQCLPDFGSLSTIAYAADGYNVPWDRVLQDGAVGLAYVLALSVLGFFLLRTREIAR